MTAQPTSNSANNSSVNSNSTCTNKTSSSATPATPATPTITADEVISQSSALNAQGLHHLKTGEEPALRSAIVSFQDSLKCMSQCFSKQTSPEHWARSFRATSTTKRPRDDNGSSNDSNNDSNSPSNSPSPLQSTLIAVDGLHAASQGRTHAAEVIFRRAFCTSQVHQVFQHETCHFKRTMNLSAAFVHFNLALSHQLCAMSMVKAILTSSFDSAVDTCNDQDGASRQRQQQQQQQRRRQIQQIQQKQLIYNELKSAQRLYQEAYRFMVSSYPQIHRGSASPYLLLNIFNLACINNMAQVEASLGQTERLKIFLERLAQFVSSVKISPSFLAAQTYPQSLHPQQSPHRRRVRRRLPSGSSSFPVANDAATINAAAGSTSSDDDGNSNHGAPAVNPTDGFIAQRVVDFFACVLVLHDYLLTSAAAAA